MLASSWQLLPSSDLADLMICQLQLPSKLDPGGEGPSWPFAGPALEQLLELGESTEDIDQHLTVHIGGVDGCVEDDEPSASSRRLFGEC
jgi:hypothetical protein